MTIYLWPFVWTLVSAVFGTVGNLVVVYVYAFHWEKCKSRIFFLMLAFLNFVNSVYSMPVEAYILWRPLDFDHELLCKTSRLSVFFINNTCVSLFITVAIDRLLLVYKPLTRRLLTVRYAKLCCLACFLIAAATAWPGYILYGTATAFEEIDGVKVTGKTCFLSDKLSGLKWPRLYNIIHVVLTIVLFTTLVIMYIFIGRKLYLVSGKGGESKTSKRSFWQIVKSVKFRSLFGSTSKQDVEPSSPVKTVQGSSKKEKPTNSRSSSKIYVRRVSGSNDRASRDNTITLLLVTMSFILSFVPYVTLVALRYMVKDFYSSMGKERRIVYHVFLRFYLFNSTLSPFIFAFSNARFRLKLFYLFWQRWRNK